MRGMTMSENPTMNLVIEVVKHRNAWTALRLVRVSQTLTASVLAVSMENASGGDHEAQEFDLLSVEQTLFGLGMQMVLAKMF